MPPETIFCFRDDLSSQSLSLVEIDTQESMTLQVIDPESYVLYDKSATSHKFSFAALSSGVYQYCINNPFNQVTLISASMKAGVKAKDYSKIAKTKDLQNIELKLKKLEDQTKEIHNKIQFLREREEQMRNTNLTIHNRVIAYSIATIVLLLCLACIQILYLKRYFKAKKMI